MLHKYTFDWIFTVFKSDAFSLEEMHSTGHCHFLWTSL